MADDWAFEEWWKRYGRQSIKQILAKRLKIEFDADPKQERFAYGGFVVHGWAEIAKLFERKVIWEGEGKIEHTDREWFGLPGCRRGLTRIHMDEREEDEFNMIGTLELWGIHGEGVGHVRMIVEDIDESRM